MKKLLLLLMAFITLGTINAQVLITEVTDPGDNYRNRFVEICNRGTAVVDISGWELERYSNGNTTNQSVIVPASTTLGGGECYVFLNSQSPLTVDCAQYTGVISGNGNDVYNLTDGANSIDTYGVIGVDGSGEAWEYEDAVVTRNSNVLTPTTTWTESEWTIKNPGNTSDGTPCVDSPLPVKLTSFNATWNHNAVELSWTTASEENNDYFVIERSTDGKEFKALDEIKGSGNSSRLIMYNYMDYQPSFTNYYRLVQVDYDGSETTSDVISIRKALKDNIRLINTQVSTYASVDNGTDEDVDYAVYSMDGRIITKGQLETGINDIDCQSLQSGIYIISMKMADQVISEKIQKF